jgi:hypothetical protein
VHQQREQSSRTALAGRGVDYSATGWVRGRPVLTSTDMVVLPKVSINPQYGVAGGTPRSRAWLSEDFRGLPGDTAEIGVDMPLLRAVAGSNGRLGAEGGREADAVEWAVSDVDAA